MSTLQQLKNLKDRLAASREKAAEISERTVTAVAPVASGAIDGFMRGRWGDPAKNGDVMIPRTDIDASAALGLALVAAGVTGYAGKQSATVAAAGGGFLAAYASRLTERKMKK